jgi:hypothetical protein
MNVQTESRATDHDITATLIEAIGSIRYGSVEIVIHDRKIVQIERKEKVRLDVPLPSRR